GSGSVVKGVDWDWDGRKPTFLGLIRQLLRTGQSQHKRLLSQVDRFRIADNLPGERGGAVHRPPFKDEFLVHHRICGAILHIVPMKPTTDKRGRLHVVAPYIKNGTVLFPRSRCEQLLGQMFNLGVESTTTGLIQGLVSQGLELPKINSIETWPPNWEIRAQRESPPEFRMLFPP